MLSLTGYASSEEDDETAEEVNDVSVQCMSRIEGQDHY
jgi:hypothetical protein